MFRTPLSAVVLVAAFYTTTPASAATCPNPDNETYVQGSDHCLAIATFRPPGRTDTLVVFLHGDISRGGPVRFGLARGISGLGAVTVAMMRPGYSGGGRSSTGIATRDQRAHEKRGAWEMNSIGAAVERLKVHHRSKRLVLVGHSGGAIISGVLLGMWPRLADAALLVSCPCDLHGWREHRGRARVATWQSPLDWLDKVRAGVRIVAVTGSADSNTLPAHAQSYVDAAKARGLDAEFIGIPGAGHNLRRQSFWPIMEFVLKEMLAR